MNEHDILDEIKRRRAMAILKVATMATIRDIGLANISRWISQGVCCSAFEEWTTLLTHGSDDEIKEIMTSTSQNANRLRQSPPYVGILDEKMSKEIAQRTREELKQVPRQ
jgi:hypothetical protein